MPNRRVVFRCTMQKQFTVVHVIFAARMFGLILTDEHHCNVGIFSQIEARKKAVEVLRDIFFSATTDIWTSPNKKSFISLVVAYIVRTPGSWRLVSLDLECSLFQEAHNGDNIATKLIALIKGGGLDLTKCISITTDNASNMVKGAADNPNLNRQACAVHTIELSVKRFVSDRGVKGVGAVGTGVENPWSAGVRGNISDGPAELQEVPKDCSAVVSHFSRSPKVSAYVSCWYVYEMFVGCLSEQSFFPTTPAATAVPANPAFLFPAGVCFNTLTEQDEVNMQYR